MLMNDWPAIPAWLLPCLTRMNEPQLARGAKETVLRIADDPMMGILNTPVIRV